MAENLWLYLQTGVSILTILANFVYLWLYTKIKIRVNRSRFCHQLRKHHLPEDLRRSLCKIYAKHMSGHLQIDKWFR
ncbi:MAG: hypothetical protein QW320_10510 [Ignisphaera sp.]